MRVHMRVHMRVQRCSNSGELDVSSRGVPGPGPRDRSPDVRQAHLHEPVASALPTDLQAAQAQATAPFRGARARGALPRHSRGASAGGRRQQPPPASVLSACRPGEPGESGAAFRDWPWRSHGATPAPVCPLGRHCRAGSRAGHHGRRGRCGWGLASSFGGILILLLKHRPRLG